MQLVEKQIAEIQKLYRKHRGLGTKETPTRTIFIDPLLCALGWNVRDIDEVELEYPTIDGKSVDYALMINGKAVILLEAKPLDDPLKDVKAITQVVGYAANDGIRWCVLSNGVVYKVYSASETAQAPDKLLYEVSLVAEGAQESLAAVASALERISRDSLAAGTLDRLGEATFVTAKVRKALDRLISERDDALVRLVRRAIGDERIQPKKIQDALIRIWQGEANTTRVDAALTSHPRSKAKGRHERGHEFDEAYHLDDVPAATKELYYQLDRVCIGFGAGVVTRHYRAKVIDWYVGKVLFCAVHVYKSRLAVWIKLREIPGNPILRDVSNIGHWGGGNVEITITSSEDLEAAKPFIFQSFLDAGGTERT